MKYDAVDRSQPDAPRASATRRRSLLLGVGAAGAAAIAAKALPVAPAEVAVAAAKPAAEPSAGYQVTQHVLRYYETTKV